MKTKVTAIFDIGKTNKKFFLFDAELQEVYREYTQFDEIEDEDGHPTENIEALTTWVKEVFGRMSVAPEFEITHLNFSCYGASLVHVNSAGKVLTPLYNYTKSLPIEISESFYNTYGSEDELSRVTGSLKMGMLNSGMQLYWLKQTKPEIFSEIRYSLHLPQYLSYLFTGIAVSDFTSIGCHTMLWNFEKVDYHDWVYQEGIEEKLAPIVAANKTIKAIINGRSIQVGVGLHDSSAALLPYVNSIKEQFVLVSTGTWSITINPFNTGMLTLGDIQRESLFNMRTNGNPVKVARLFLGNEYQLQTEALSGVFKLPEDYHKQVKFNQAIFDEINLDDSPKFKWFGLSNVNTPEQTFTGFKTFEHAYHQLMKELVLLQVESIKAAASKEQTKHIYIDGGFTNNDLFVILLKRYLKNSQIHTTQLALGSALGAAMAMFE